MPNGIRCNPIRHRTFLCILEMLSFNASIDNASNHSSSIATTIFSQFVDRKDHMFSPRRWSIPSSLNPWIQNTNIVHCCMVATSPTTSALVEINYSLLYGDQRDLFPILGWGASKLCLVISSTSSSASLSIFGGSSSLFYQDQDDLFSILELKTPKSCAVRWSTSSSGSPSLAAISNSIIYNDQHTLFSIFG